MSAPESLRDEVAAVLAEHHEDYDDDCGTYYGCSCGWDNETVDHNTGYPEHLADALLASPALARVIREAKAEAWDEGQAGGYICAQGYHAHGDGHGPDPWDCDCPNPYRDEQS